MGNDSGAIVCLNWTKVPWSTFQVEDAGSDGHEVTPTPRQTGADAQHIAGGYVKETANTFASAIVQIILLDMVFSIDSVITAVGMAKRLEVMSVARHRGRRCDARLQRLHRALR